MILDLDVLRTIPYQKLLSANAAGISEVLDGDRYLMDLARQVAPCLLVMTRSETVDPRRVRAADVIALCQAAKDTGVMVIGAEPLTVVKVTSQTVEPARAPCARIR